MTKHFRRELEHLSREILLMGGLAETALSHAVRAFRECDAELAEAVVEGDAELNEIELRVEEEVLKLLALYQPIARDLRFVVGVFQISNDLERVGDLAVNIAERALSRESAGERPGFRDLDAMADQARAMVSLALDAFVTQDQAKAEQVLGMDDTVDQLLEKIYASQKEFIAEERTNFESALRILSTAKYLERIADHATNIADDVIYMVSGDLVKHHH